MSKQTGIYSITTIVSDKIYIGSASISFHKRWQEHASQLQRNIHHNRHLQNTWNKYGGDVFRFNIIEVVTDLSRILEREQYWIDCYFHTGKCFNLTPTAGSNRGLKRTEEQRRRMKEILNSPEVRAKQSKARRGKKKPQSFIDAIAKTVAGLIGPDGTVYAPIKNLHAFAKEHGIHGAHLNEVVNGKRKSIQGWRLIDTSAPVAYSFHFIAPDGTHYRDISNLTAFCRLHKLLPSGLCNVHSGKAKQHKGWRKG